MKFTIKAILKTTSPMLISTAGNYRYNSDTGRVETETAGNSGNMIPCTAVQKMDVLGCNFPQPVIPANNIAGRLRRHAAEMVLKAISAKGEKVSLSAYSSLMCGAVGGSPDARDLSYAEYKKSTEHVYLGLFGGGPRMLRRKVRVQNALPINQAVLDVIENAAHPQAKDFVQERRITMAWTARRNDDLADLVNVQLQEDTIDNYVEEIQKRQATILEEKTKGRSITTTFSFSAIEFVLPGTHFNFGFELDVNNDAQLGLFLAALDSFVTKERIGAKSVNGLGQFALKNVLLTDEDDNETNIFFNNRLNQENEVVKKYMDAWLLASANIDKATIEEMMTIPSEVALQKKEKAAKKAGQVA